LAVGDARFQEKCLERLRAVRAAGGTLVLTSHSREQIRALCDRVLVLDEGRVAAEGEPSRALACYDDLMSARTRRRADALGVAPPAPPARGSRQGTQEVTLTAVRILDGRGESVDTLESGGDVAIELDYRLQARVLDFAVSVAVYEESTRCVDCVI